MHVHEGYYAYYLEQAQQNNEPSLLNGLVEYFRGVSRNYLAHQQNQQLNNYDYTTDKGFFKTHVENDDTTKCF